MSKESVTVAGIDCGTNSIRLKVARVDENGMTEIVPRHSTAGVFDKGR